MAYVMRSRSTVGGALAMFWLLLPLPLDSDSVMEAVLLRRTWTGTALRKPYDSVVLGLGQR